MSPVGCVARILVSLVVLGALGAAAYILYQTWLGAGLERSASSADLSRTQRLYLEYYLSQRSADLERPAGTGTTLQSFIIAPGEGAAVIAQRLQTVGLLNDTELFLNYLTYYGLDGGLVTGDYQLDPQQTIPELADALGAGGARALELSFLPGWRSEEMANYLSITRPARIEANAFNDIVRTGGSTNPKQYTFLASLPAGTSLEGYLFPGFYQIQLDHDSRSLVEQMLANFDRQVTPQLRQAFGEQGLSIRDAVILASIIEKEATLPEEKPLMASVFLNRLHAGMPLQADPTVQYALGYQSAGGTWWKSPLEAADLGVESPYNTYLVDGLPPGPISNPGLASLEAVAFPAVSDYLYFVLDCEAEDTGRHVFSTTFEEHVSHVERCR
jgi:UPF0755 protein